MAGAVARDGGLREAGLSEAFSFGFWQSLREDPRATVRRGRKNKSPRGLHRVRSDTGAHTHVSSEHAMIYIGTHFIIRLRCLMANPFIYDCPRTLGLSTAILWPRTARQRCGGLMSISGEARKARIEKFELEI